METIKEFNSMISDITSEIQEKYPELTKYIDEMTITIPKENKPEISIRTLKEYYNSLKSFVKGYIQSKLTK